ncbi:MAG: bifunctional DNA-formamidopyrimidine glycosylase/DNA-(apurinic or apyrimidinic site) lyase [Pseudomonadales bacterium]|jgi:formamidopyrimidine-DNA glycosylase|nr:bifunctional DNA-formamidopyrimidine glycosylase/DNA-(apurinic or apyrimidinic site) lyase [Pseudomonadales bacterium]
MPELPEVETVRHSLEPFLIGQTIVSVDKLHQKSFLNPLKIDIIGKTIISVGRRGKYIILALDDKKTFILTHLKMTGQLLYKDPQQLAGGGHPAADTLAQLPGKHTRIIYNLIQQKTKRHSQLLFNDMRIFGWMKVVNKELLDKEFSNLGPDANSKDITPEYLYDKFQRRRLPIKQVIMDNQVLTGIGNIYASEILFDVKISPLRPANKITFKETERILKASREILNKAIKAGGTTFDGRYVDALGKSGNFEKNLMVYGRAGQPCKICNDTIVNVKLGGRSSFYCPTCQPK